MKKADLKRTTKLDDFAGFWFLCILVPLFPHQLWKKNKEKKRILSNNYHFHKLGAERSDSKEILCRSRASLFISNCCLINGIFSFLADDYNIVT